MACWLPHIYAPGRDTHTRTQASDLERLSLLFKKSMRSNEIIFSVASGLRLYYVEQVCKLGPSA